jgi:membrane-bound serine protease (ClpP class)
MLELEGVINPVAARYVEQGVERAARQDARAVVLKLDTPGGTKDAMRDMV